MLTSAIPSPLSKLESLGLRFRELASEASDLPHGFLRSPSVLDAEAAVVRVHNEANSDRFIMNTAVLKITSLRRFLSSLDLRQTETEATSIISGDRAAIEGFTPPTLKSSVQVNPDEPQRPVASGRSK